MAINDFIPELWAGRVLDNLQKVLVYGAPGVVNRDYEGQIRQAGDTVKINNIGALTAGTYTADTDISSIDALSDSTRSLDIDQSRFVAFQIDDITAAQSSVALMDAAMREAAYALGDAADQFIAAQMVSGGSSVSTGIDTTPDKDTAYENLVALSIALDEANAPREGRWVVVSPAYHGLLLKDSRFVSPGGGDTTTLQNGRVGRAAGFTIYTSNNCPLDTTNKVVLAGHPSAITYAEQLVKTEAFRMENRFADAVKMLHVYGAKVTRATLLRKFSSSV